MTVRFRIRTPAGQELSFASHEMFEDFVRSGDLSPDDLVYDGETGSWSPARTHPIVLEIEYAREAAGEDAKKDAPAPTRPEGGAPEEGAAAEEGTAAEAEPPAEGGVPEGETMDLSFGLELAEQQELSPEEAQKAFLEKMRAERESELDFDEQVSGFTMETSGSLADLVSPGSPAPTPPPPPPSTSSPSPASPPTSPPPSRKAPSGPGAGDHAGQRGGAPRPAEPRPTASARSKAPARPDPSRSASGGRPVGPPASRQARKGKKQKKSGGGVGKFFGLLLVAAIVAGGGYVGLTLAQRTPAPEPTAGPEPEEEAPVRAIPVEPEVAPPPAPEPVIAATESAVRERARERFLTATQNALRDLQPIPDAWPAAGYLTAPSNHPDVLDVWQSYLDTIRRVRGGDEARYRAAYEAALDDAGVTGEERDQRLETAMAVFMESAEVRNAHWDRVEVLASSAIQSHNALVESEGLLIASGVGDPGPEAPVGAGVTARDDESQLLLDQVVQLLGASLEAEGLGPGTASNVRAWVWDGFLDATAN